jgi:trk system potassium uptake protein TrkA
MNMIVVGCGRVGTELAYRLFQKGHKVSVIDLHASAFTSLPADFLGRTVEGEALNQEILHRAGIEDADGLAAVTSSDTLNAVVAHIANHIYNVPSVVSRNYDPAYRGLHEAFHLQTVSSSSWGAQRIEEILAHSEMRTVFSSGNGEVELYEVGIPPVLDGHSLQELIPPENCCPVSLTRAGKAMLTDLNMQLQERDLLLVSATFDGIEEVRRRMKAAQEG